MRHNKTNFTPSEKRRKVAISKSPLPQNEAHWSFRVILLSDWNIIIERLGNQSNRPLAEPMEAREF